LLHSLCLSGAHQDVATSMSSHHVILSKVHHLAVAKLKLSECRSSTTVLNQVWLSFTVLCHQSSGGPKIQAWRLKRMVMTGIGMTEVAKKTCHWWTVRRIWQEWLPRMRLNHTSLKTNPAFATGVVKIKSNPNKPSTTLKSCYSTDHRHMTLEHSTPSTSEITTIMRLIYFPLLCHRMMHINIIPNDNTISAISELW